MMIDLQLLMLGRLALAVLLGGLIGLERQAHGRPAGLRTHILVCVGSTLIMAATAAFGPEVDPGRAVAGIVTGVGFLGAGVIVKSQDVVRGLTTAACIWFVAALGIVVGQGLYVLSVGTTAVGLLVLTVLGRLAHKVPSTTYHTARIVGTAEAMERLEKAASALLVESGYRVMGLSTRVSRAADRAELVFRLRTTHGGSSLDLTRALLSLPEADDVEWT